MAAVLPVSQTTLGLRVELYVADARPEDFPMPVEIESADGRSRRAEAFLDPSGRRALVDIEAGWLSPGHFELALELEGASAHYEFQVR